jgi:GT2 family glycosyltransferase
MSKMLEASEVAVVILNWNGKKYLEEFLPSVINHTPGARVIVADNASSDDSIPFLQTKFPSIEIIQNEHNGGFAKGYNEALKKVDSKYYVLLNSDIEVTENWLSPLMETMKDEKVAGCQPKVRSYHKKDYLEHAGAAGGFIDINYFPFCRGRIFETVEKDEQQYDYPLEVFWATGACLMIRSKSFHTAGGFDEDFFAHMEEIDLCWRIKLSGQKFMVAPSSTVFHVGGGTLPYSSPRKTYLNFRNSLFMIIKNHKGWLAPKLFWRLCIDGVGGFRFLMKGEFNQLSAVLKAHMSVYRNLNKFLRKRRVIQKDTENANLTGLFTGNILWNFYIKGVKHFTDLNQRLFL